LHRRVVVHRLSLANQTDPQISPILGLRAAFAVTFAATLRPWWGLAGTTTLAFVLALWLVMPAIDLVRSYRPAAQWLVERIPPNGMVGFLHPGHEKPNVRRGSATWMVVACSFSPHPLRPAPGWRRIARVCC